MKQDIKKRNDVHRYICNGTDGLIRESTKDRDIENLSKVQNARPLKPPRRRTG